MGTENVLDNDLLMVQVAQNILVAITEETRKNTENNNFAVKSLEIMICRENNYFIARKKYETVKVDIKTTRDKIIAKLNTEQAMLVPEAGRIFTINNTDPNYRAIWHAIESYGNINDLWEKVICCYSRSDECFDTKIISVSIAENKRHFEGAA